MGAGRAQPSHLPCSVGAAVSWSSAVQREGMWRPGPARSYKHLAEAAPGSGASRTYKQPGHANVPAAPSPGHGQQLQQHIEVPALVLLHSTPLRHGSSLLQQQFSVFYCLDPVLCRVGSDEEEPLPAQALQSPSRSCTEKPGLHSAPLSEWKGNTRTQAAALQCLIAPAL